MATQERRQTTVERGGAQYSVYLRHNDYARVKRAARMLKMSTSAFMRETVLTRARGIIGSEDQDRK